MDIQIKDLCKAYHGKQVLDHITLDFSIGEAHCVMAPSGYGKTTLLNIMMGLETADSGTISGLERHRLAPVFQEDRLCENLSVGANLRLTSRERIAEQDMEDCLAALMLPGCLHNPVRELSGGMKRRVAIARALLCGRDILLMDEPFRGLDWECKEQVILYIKRVAFGKTIVCVTHDEEEIGKMGGSLLRLGA